MKSELARKKKQKQFVILRPMTYSYLTNDRFVDKKAKCTKKRTIKREIKFKDCKKVPGIQENDTKITSKVEEGVGQSIHGNTKRIALSTNDDKRL